MIGLILGSVVLVIGIMAADVPDKAASNGLYFMCAWYAVGFVLAAGLILAAKFWGRQRIRWVFLIGKYYDAVIYGAEKGWSAVQLLAGKALMLIGIWLLRPACFSGDLSNIWLLLPASIAFLAGLALVSTVKRDLSGFLDAQYFGGVKG